MEGVVMVPKLVHGSSLVQVELIRHGEVLQTLSIVREVCRALLVLADGAESWETQCFSQLK